MRIIGIFNYFSRNPDANLIKEISLLQDQYDMTLMKQRAIDVVIGRVGRSLSLVNWKTYEKGKYNPDDLYYHLNVEPNVNQNSTEFWQEVVQKLFEEQEVLIVITQDDQFTIADSFEVEKLVLKPNLYYNVQKDEMKFNRSFSEDEVIHLTYYNLNLKKIFQELDESYGKLFARLVQVAMRTNQIRGTAKLTGQLAKNDKAIEYLQTFVDKLFAVFKNKSVAIAPVQDGMEYEEFSREQNTRSQVDELNKVSDEYLNTVLEAVGIHPALVSGDMAEVEKHQDHYISGVIQPLVELIADEINRKFYLPKEFLEGSRLKPSVVRLRYISIFDVGNSAEKIIESAVTNPNEVREELDLEPVEEQEMYAYYLTKNIQPLKGGDDDKQEIGANDG